MNVRDRIARLLGTDGLQRIEQAVARAESGISGEIVTYVCWQCDSYPEAAWKGAALAAAAACLALFAADLRQPLWQPLPVLLAAILAASALGALAGHLIPPLRRRLIGSRRLAARAHSRANEVFLQKEVFRTARRTGMLLFVSLFERHAVIVADSGINAKVGASEWDKIVARLVDQARDEDLTNGILAAIGRCREVLLQAGFKAEPGERNELDDKPALERPAA